MDKKQVDINYNITLISDFLKNINKFYLVVNNNELKYFNNFVNSSFLPTNFNDRIISAVKNLYTELIKIDLEELYFIN
ncbi:MAG: hypothetical protein QXY79_04930, partial [Candidatus Methanomethylicia archaeon]